MPWYHTEVDNDVDDDIIWWYTEIYIYKTCMHTNLFFNLDWARVQGINSESKGEKLADLAWPGFEPGYQEPCPVRACVHTCILQLGLVIYVYVV